MDKRVDKSAKEKADKVDSVSEEDSPKTADEYQCSGNLQSDLLKLCKLMCIKEIPSVKRKKAVSESPSSERKVTEFKMSTWSPKPCLQIELENEDHQSIKVIKMSGWLVDKKMLQVLSRILPSISSLQCLHVWRVGLTDSTFTSLRNIISLCSNLRKVVLEGNPLPEQRYHLIIEEASMLTELSLRNNRIGEKGARLIGSALSTACSGNKNLLSLNLAFNSVGDAGAVCIAQGLRFNQTLLYLSLSYNHISDKGAAHLAEVLGPFALKHEEIVERRKLLFQKGEQSMLLQPSQVSLTDSTCERPLSVQSSSSLDRPLNRAVKKKDNNLKKEEKPAPGQAPKKEESKVAKKDNKVTRGQTGKLGNKDKNLTVSEQETVADQTVDVTETVMPLLDPKIQHAGGKVIYPGNTCLTYLNLSGNKLTEESLKLFLSSLESQGDRGLRRLSLNRNCFSPDCDSFLKVQERMSQKDPSNKNSSGQMEDEGQVEAQSSRAA